MKEIRIKVKESSLVELQDLEKWYGVNFRDIIRDFIEDLTGTPGNGSDERMYAKQWFSRRGYSFLREIAKAGKDR